MRIITAVLAAALLAGCGITGTPSRAAPPAAPPGGSTQLGPDLGRLPMDAPAFVWEWNETGPTTIALPGELDEPHTSDAPDDTMTFTPRLTDRLELSADVQVRSGDLHHVILVARIGDGSSDPLVGAVVRQLVVAAGGSPELAATIGERLGIAAGPATAFAAVTERWPAGDVVFDVDSEPGVFVLRAAGSP